MTRIKDIKGMKYPDEYFTKFFFKNKLHEKANLTYLEFGCGNGNNLMLPYSYGGNRVVGIDFNSSNIDNADFNFKLFNNKKSQYEYHADDMRKFVQNNSNINADILLLPSIICYISKQNFLIFLENLVLNCHIKNNIHFYIRLRTPKDFRFGLGLKIDDNTYKLPNNVITGEENALMTFFTESEIINILQKYLNLRDFKIFHLDDQNEHQNEIILNSDIAIWGTIN